MTLITDYEVRSTLGTYKFITYSIGPIEYRETRDRDGILKYFTCLYQGKEFLDITPALYKGDFHLKCSVSGIDI